jgi:hypothetical protein
MSITVDLPLQSCMFMPMLFSEFHIFYQQFCDLLIEFVYVELQFSHVDLGLHHTMSNPAVLEPPCYYDIFAVQVPAPNQQHLPSQQHAYYGRPFQPGDIPSQYLTVYQQPPITVNVQQQQQQQQQQQPTVYTTVYKESFSPHMTLACITLWFCNCPFGLIAFILARK